MLYTKQKKMEETKYALVNIDLYLLKISYAYFNYFIGVL
jgi:hypothetical protein